MKFFSRAENSSFFKKRKKVEKRRDFFVQVIHLFERVFREVEFFKNFFQQKSTIT